MESAVKQTAHIPEGAEQSWRAPPRPREPASPSCLHPTSRVTAALDLFVFKLLICYKYLNRTIHYAQPLLNWLTGTPWIALLLERQTNHVTSQLIEHPSLYLSSWSLVANPFLC